jgi:signal transduction histidine kinase/CheY-like chemotaxis protein
MVLPRLLVVEDNAAVLEAVAGTLRARLDGVAVEGCRTAPEALARVAAVDYDAIVSDIRMPGMDGLALLGEIRALRPDTPTILVTGAAQHDLATRALRGGAYDLIEKPIDWNYFVAALRRAMRTRELCRQVERQTRDLERLARECLEARDRAREEAAAAQARLAFLADASVRLAASLDLDATVAVSVGLAVPTLADWCVLDLLEADMTVRRVAAAHADPARCVRAEQLKAFAPPVEGQHPVTRTLRTGEPTLLPDVSGDRVGALARGAEHLALLRDLGVASYMCVPLVTRGRTLGALSLVSARPDRRYGAVDLALAAELGRRVGQAIDNARLYHDAQEAVRMRDDFLARASHELRTPLTSALGTVRLLRKAAEGALRESPEALIDIASRNLVAMATLIDHLLDASKLASGRDTLVLEPTEVASVVARSLEVVGAQAREKGVRVTCAVPPGLALRADALKLEQVFVNLLANAVKFTPAGGEVAVEAVREDGQVAVRVRDTGQGIPREHLETIFQPFFQAMEASRRPGDRRARRARGAGLGLAICRQIVELHGGAIRAESEGPGRGSTFTVRLPESRPIGLAA